MILKYINHNKMYRIGKQNRITNIVLLYSNSYSIL